MKYFPTTKEWREWLVDNHEKESRMTVIRYKKHTGKPSPSHLELMHEAICFGWIDTTVKRLDDEKYLINFAKRTDKSRWSSNTLSYAKKMIAEKRMYPQGLKRYKEGLKKPTIDSLVSKNPEMPADLKAELTSKHALSNFEAFAPSYKRTWLRWLEHAKLEETRKKRINVIVTRSLQKNGKWAN